MYQYQLYLVSTEQMHDLFANFQYGMIKKIQLLYAKEIKLIIIFKTNNQISGYHLIFQVVL